MNRLHSVNSSIAITGLGLATCLGLDAETVWSAVRRGACGIGPMSAMESPLTPGKDGGQAPDLPADYSPALPREARYLRWTVEAALRDAGLGDSYASSRRVTLLGTTLHGMRAAGDFLRSDDYRKLNTFLAGDTLHLAFDGLGFNGLAATTCSACSSSLGAIALAVTLLERGECDVVLAGGYDTISEYVWAGFNALRLVSDPPLRPFTRGRCGMKVAEGYGIVVLERAADAERRGAKPKAIVAGWGESADAFHLTRPQPEGSGALAAMRQAITRAGIDARDLDLIAAHATGTPDNDSSEAAAITTLIGEHRTPVVGFKSHLGHTLGGAGAVELILSALAMRDGIVPPSANIDASGIEYDALAITHTAERAATIRHTLNTSLGFGGANTCVVLRSCSSSSAIGEASSAHAKQSAPASATPVPQPSRPKTEASVVITGVGVLIPGAIGNDAFCAYLAQQQKTDRRTIDDVEFEHLVANARRMRRMSPYVKLSLCAATLACKDAGLLDSPALLESAGAILGTTHGSAGYSYDYYAQIIREGVGAANPMLFAEGVPNAAAAQLSLMLTLRGACQTIIGTATAGLDALRLAASRIASGAADRIIVCAAEESHFTLDNAYAACPGSEERSQSSSVACAVAFIVESRAAAQQREAIKQYAVIGQSGSATDVDGRLTRTLAAAVEHAGVESRPRLADVALAGNAFSVAPLLSLAAGLLGGASLPSSVVAIDRNRFATAVAIDAC